MTKKSKIIFSENDILSFRKWLCLDMKSVTWQGKYSQDFEDFWELFFSANISLTELSKRFKYAIEKTNVGPLASWFTWLRNKLICYTFVEKKIGISELCTESNLRDQIVGIVLRDFFSEVFPHCEDYFNEHLLITNKLSKNYRTTIDSIMSDLEENPNFSGSHDQEIMASMEVTLYDDWSYFIRKMKKDFSGRTLNLSKVNTREYFKSTLQSFVNVLAIVGIAFFLVWALEFANKKYKTYLEDKISIYEPQFRWEDKGLKFTDASKEVILDSFELDETDIENVDDSENLLGESLEDRDRESVESEVVLTSWDSLPKDFDVADSEVSDYEEGSRRGYRDSRYGNTKVYRVMMRSSDTTDARQKLTGLIDRYKVSQVDNVKPGLAVPGGFYYNLYVPRTYLKEFMAQVQSVDTAIIYESRTRTRKNPVGKNKVFIWVKAI